MLIITSNQEVTEVLSSIDHSLAKQWLANDIIKKNLAISYDYWLEDTGIPMTLREYVLQYLDHAEYLGGIFSPDSEIDEMDC
nr:hypothetical protein [Neobacillus sp. Marseille-Q6967]